jgi:hypothetical protein
MIVLPPKNLGIPAHEPITLSNQLPHLRKYLREIDPKVGWAKFSALAEGARIASERLWV